MKPHKPEGGRSRRPASSGMPQPPPDLYAQSSEHARSLITAYRVGSGGGTSTTNQEDRHG